MRSFGYLSREGSSQRQCARVDVSTAKRVTARTWRTRVAFRAGGVPPLLLAWRANRCALLRCASSPVRSTVFGGPLCYVVPFLSPSFRLPPAQGPPPSFSHHVTPLRCCARTVGIPPPPPLLSIATNRLFCARARVFVFVAVFAFPLHSRLSYS